MALNKSIGIRSSLLLCSREKLPVEGEWPALMMVLSWCHLLLQCPDVETKLLQLWELTTLSPGQAIRPINLREKLFIHCCHCIINMVLITGYLLNHCDDGWGHPTVIPPGPLLAPLSWLSAPLDGARAGGICQVLSSGSWGDEWCSFNHCYVFGICFCFAHIYFKMYDFDKNENNTFGGQNLQGERQFRSWGSSHDPFSCADTTPLTVTLSD